ncbi:MAG: SsrA-binding protein SmpB [Chloroflexi bacterium]|nr:SsrA-binding protein SmpB [Chloroflexota bacterium]
MARGKTVLTQPAGSGSAAAAPEKRPERTYASNKRALHEYAILERIEAGLALQGTEVKSVRAGNVDLRDAYARAQNGEIWLWNAHIYPWEQGSIWNHEPRRARKLLLHTREIGRLAARAGESGNTLVPLRVYDRRGRIKVELGLARGKKQYDKRQAISERESKREIDRALKESGLR